LKAATGVPLHSLTFQRRHTILSRVSSTVACASVAVDKRLPCRCLEMAASTHFTIPVFSRHVTVRHSIINNIYETGGWLQLI
jgi:hypothetical protein